MRKSRAKLVDIVSTSGGKYTIDEVAVLRLIIQLLRLEKGMSQEAFGEAIRLSQGHWSRMEWGHTPIPVQLLAPIAASFGLSLADLLELYVAVLRDIEMLWAMWRVGSSKKRLGIAVSAIMAVAEERVRQALDR